MARTEIHPISSTLNIAIDYIIDPEKTDDQRLCSTYRRANNGEYQYKLDSCCTRCEAIHGRKDRLGTFNRWLFQARSVSEKIYNQEKECVTVTHSGWKE